ncbi:MAG: hypothetical protein H0V62_07840 [Gammaproteobacteria bacterium]|nr:hypothetical protein [Gammaproteobacteria bacterium]
MMRRVSAFLALAINALAATSEGILSIWRARRTGAVLDFVQHIQIPSSRKMNIGAAGNIAPDAITPRINSACGEGAPKIRDASLSDDRLRSLFQQLQFFY